jgi:hypothetical protein
VKLRSRWQDNIKIDIKVRVYEDVDWIYLVCVRDYWRALVTMVINLWVP